MQPQNPDPKFDFMLKNNPPAKRMLGWPNMPKPAKLALIATGIILLSIIIGSALSGGGSKANTDIIGALARGQETLRVTTEVQTLNLQDPATQALAVTVNSALTSDHQQLVKYLAANKAKVSASQLAVDLDKTVDAQMQSASQNNNLDQTYKDYLRQSMAKYQADLANAYTVAGSKGKQITKSMLDGINTLLSNPPLKSQ